ncbi:DUF1853 family protein [Paraburkholderia humisilvae]|uniref:DUF1853 domain-containing protein n=1 Tax=Paraburkholderia humisilvae TaxID=627669 RepID=A0A6J5D330_9BURK|nr:DUF1853 family protein [Paraburkholderia humisilvae]CAB3747827.1 hypothetical protein LMG29542_00568 [Paraburkholderia humisilvae]
MAADGPTAGLPPRVAARLEQLTDPAVRDLAWLLFSPDLLRAQPPAGVRAEPFESADEAVAMVDWLVAQDAHPVALHQHIAAAQVTRLGRYAECLLAWCLRYGPGARLVAANVALRRGGLTLGECDFLVHTQTRRRLHWELAVKCYLHAGDGRAQLADYVAPNLQDRFDVKLHRLLDHQLPLSARAEFAALGHSGPWEAQMFVKGWLFYRDGGRPPEPPALDPAHARGWWTTRAEWPAFAAAQGHAWAVLPRLQWLSRRRRNGDAAAAGLFDIPSLSAQLAQHSGPTMVAAFAAEGEAGNWRETSRGFVVPDGWPVQALAFARR